MFMINHLHLIFLFEYCTIIRHVFNIFMLGINAEMTSIILSMRFCNPQLF